jgi:hypothetical protein
MPIQTWEALLGNVPAVGAGSALASSSSATDISPAPQVTINGGQLYLGQRIRLIGYGIFSTTGTPNLTLGGYYGGVAGTALATTGTVATGNNAASWPWRLQLEIEVRTLGTSGTLWCNGIVYLGTSLTAMTPLWIPNSQTQPITVNTTTANALTIGATWGTPSSSNTITCEDAYIEAVC